VKRTPFVVFAVAMLLGILPLLQAQTYEILYSFTYQPNPENPYAGVIFGPAGLYGTTVGGESLQYGRGTVYKVSLTGQESSVYDFLDSPDGALPYAPLVSDASGAFYGTTAYGGTINSNCRYGCGTVFKVEPGGSETVLYRFKGGRDGGNPYGGLTRDPAGNLYGTTTTGGDSKCTGNYGPGCGTVFKFEPSGKFAVLHIFGASEGAAPQASLLRDDRGNLYGISQALPHWNTAGAIFQIDPSGRESILHKFAQGQGGDPTTALIRDPQGNLYGSADFGDPNNCGAVFKLSPTGRLTNMHTFTPATDGCSPTGLVRDASGNLYGVANIGGAYSNGTIFELKHSGGKWTTVVLHNFTGYPTDGANPHGTLLRDKNGHLSGTTFNGGSADYGTVFRLTP
jgi:uncharacterized repeat protein (TIGR03803 family)